MKNVVGVFVCTGLMLFLSGCSNTASAEKEYAYNINKHHLIHYNSKEYYYAPNHSWSQILNANAANLNNVASGDILDCKENDIWFISLNEREKEEKVRYRYIISLAKNQLMKMEDNATYIPRRNSKEFKDLTETDTQMAHKGLIGCSGRISKESFSKIRTK